MRRGRGFLLFVPAALCLGAAGVVPGRPGGPAAAIDAAARATAAERVRPPDRFETIASRVDPVPDLPGPVAVVPLGTEGPGASGIVRVRFRLLRDGVAVAEARATVRGVVRGPAVVAVKPLPRGRAIGPDVVAVQDSDLTRLLGPPLREAAAAIGRVPVRTLGAGRALTADLLASAPLVRQGEEVSLRLEQQGLTVTQSGRARRDGSPGETIPVQCLRTGALLLARVQDDGSLVVVGRAAAGGTR
jgi:flagella basal body P-ring formation protein FlgA